MADKDFDSFRKFLENLNQNPPTREGARQQEQQPNNQQPPPEDDSGWFGGLMQSAGETLRDVGPALGPMGMLMNPRGRRAAVDTMNIPTLGLAGGAEQLGRAGRRALSEDTSFQDALTEERAAIRQERDDMPMADRIASTGMGILTSFPMGGAAIRGASAGAQTLSRASPAAQSILSGAGRVASNPAMKYGALPAAAGAGAAITEGLGSAETGPDNIAETGLLGGVLGLGAGAVGAGVEGLLKRAFRKPGDIFEPGGRQITESVSGATAANRTRNIVEDAASTMESNYLDPGTIGRMRGRKNYMEKRLGLPAGSYGRKEFYQQLDETAPDKIPVETFISKDGDVQPFMERFLQRVANTDDTSIYSNTAQLMRNRVQTYGDQIRSIVSDAIDRKMPSRMTYNTMRRNFNRTRQELNERIARIKERVDRPTTPRNGLLRWWKRPTGILESLEENFFTPEAQQKGLDEVGEQIRRLFRERVIEPSNLKAAEMFNSGQIRQMPNGVSPAAVMDFRTAVNQIVKDAMDSGRIPDRSALKELTAFDNAVDNFFGGKSSQFRQAITKHFRNAQRMEMYELGGKDFANLAPDDFIETLREMRKARAMNWLPEENFNAYIQGIGERFSRLREDKGVEAFRNVMRSEGGRRKVAAVIDVIEGAKPSQIGGERGLKAVDQLLEDLGEVHEQLLVAENFLQRLAREGGFEMSEQERLVRDAVDTLFAAGPGAIGNQSLTGRINALRQLLGRGFNPGSNHPGDVLFDYMMGTPGRGTDPSGGLQDMFELYPSNVRDAAQARQFGNIVSGATAGAAGPAAGYPDDATAPRSIMFPYQ